MNDLDVKYKELVKLCNDLNMQRGNSMFLEYLEEAYTNATPLQGDYVRLYIIPFYKKLLDDEMVGEEYILYTLPTSVVDYFDTVFARCEICHEWNRIDDMPVGHKYSHRICPTCRGE